MSVGGLPRIVQHVTACPSCGGTTEVPENVWRSANAAQVFACVPDAFCDGDPHYKWQLTMSYSTLRSRLRRAGIPVW